MTETVSPYAHRIFRDADLRQVTYDGSPISWRVSAYVVIIEGDQVLLIKDVGEQSYDVVGGGIELGEDLHQGISRESLEEAGATVIVENLIEAKVDWFYHRKEKTFYQTLQLYYTATLVGELKAPLDGSIEWRGFVPISEVQTEYHVQPIVAQVITQAHHLAKSSQ